MNISKYNMTTEFEFLDYLSYSYFNLLSQDQDLDDNKLRQRNYKSSFLPYGTKSLLQVLLGS